MLITLDIHADKSFGTHIDERIWRRRRFASWRAAICFCCISGTVLSVYCVQYLILCWNLNTLNVLQMGHSLEAFLQWKAVVSLLLGCTEAVSYTFEASHLHAGLSLTLLSNFSFCLYKLILKPLHTRTRLFIKVITYDFVTHLRCSFLSFQLKFIFVICF